MGDLSKGVWAGTYTAESGYARYQPGGFALTLPNPARAV